MHSTAWQKQAQAPIVSFWTVCNHELRGCLDQLLFDSCYTLEINEWLTSKSVKKHMFSVTSVRCVSEVKKPVVFNTWHFVLLLAFPTHFSLETSQTRGDNCAMTDIHAPGLTNTNSLRVLKGLKSTARFTNRSFQLHLTLWLDCNAISYTILIQFAVTDDHALSFRSAFWKLWQPGWSQLSQPIFNTVAPLAELINLLIEFNSFRLYMLMQNETQATKNLSCQVAKTQVVTSCGLITVW